MTKWIATLAIGAALALGSPNKAEAQDQDGLVNVAVYDITIIGGSVVLVLNRVVSDVNIGVAAQIAANVCGVSVGPIAVLGHAVDRSGNTRTACQTAEQVVRLEQN